MTLSLLKKLSRKRDRIVVVDLSTRGAKAVHVRRAGDGFALVDYWLQEEPAGENGGSQERLVAQLKSVRRALGGASREAVLVVGMEESLVRNIEAPLAKRDELREMLRFNSEHFFKQEMSEFAFDCFVPCGRRAAGATTAKPGEQPNVLVGAVKRPLLGEVARAAKRAGIAAVQVTVNQTGLANAALLAKTSASHKECLALLHIGANASTIGFLADGTLAFTRVIGIGSTQLSGPLAEAYRISEHVPEELKASIIKSNLESVLAPLAREARAAIDYFESLQSKRVVTGYVTGDLTRSNLIVEMLQVLEIPCERLDLTTVLTVDLPTGKETEIEKDLPRLDVAVGAAVGWLDPEGIEINLLAEEIDAARLRRRDPVRWTAGLGISLVLFLLSWAVFLKLQSRRADTELNKARTELKSLEIAAREATANTKEAGEVARTLSALEQHATNRFLWALPLNALQHAIVDNVQVVGLRIEQTLARVESAKTNNRVPAKLAETREQIVLSITAKNFADNEAEDEFIERLSSLAYFRDSLRKKDPVLLKNRMPRQVDPLDPTKTFTLLTIECVYPERILGREYIAQRKTR